MAREQFNDLLWFLAVAEERSFTRAAARLGISQSTLSHTIKRLETRMGVLLLNRTTRNVATTEAGERLQQSLSPRIAEIEAEMASIMEYRNKPAGRIRLTLSDHALHTVVWPKLRDVLVDYPDIKVEFSVDSAFRNIVDSGFDAGIRLGESVENDMIAVKIGPDWRLVAVASPAYLAARGAPLQPKDLIGHNCIGIRQVAAGGLYAWEFEKDGSELRVRVDGQLTFAGSYEMVDAALRGYGIAYVPEDIVASQIAAGDLVVVLDDWSQPFPGYFIYYPSRRQNLPAFRVVVEALRHR
ncbi:LysR family transcriptional regulator [Paracoccus sp. PAR01]|uniref:LysR family transcriptional regulator n=1 Tax=Paracoccus sp. PAR01 TaxID=2769282 RepID=UPI001782C65A|nr:LysR family transcriptional regulator [Paracoccus sp. PAR01]MBD9529556.1 LysR family transcriptional regulator [Paracoccus sp. PAR01]